MKIQGDKRTKLAGESSLGSWLSLSRLSHISPSHPYNGTSSRTLVPVPSSAPVSNPGLTLLTSDPNN